MQNLAYDWDGVGNLKWRKDDNQNLTEAFVYDNLHRLTSSTRNGTSNLVVSYNALGNISSKSGVGTYTYHATKKHAVVSTSGGGSYGYDANGNMTSRNGSTISWTSYNLPGVINGSGSNQSQFFYTPDRARYKQVANYAGTVETTIYVGGLLEKLTRGALTEYRHLIQAGEDHTVLYTRRTNGSTDLYHVTRDHLGSASAITNSAGTVLVNESFTAFGERRGSNWAGTPSAADWTQIANTTRRGFTDHEHLDNLNLIHMNGRVYDPGLGRFISADPFIDGWTSTQGYNRYSYVRNNPLRYFDPSGFKGKSIDEKEESEGSGGGEIIVVPPVTDWSERGPITPRGGGGEPVEESLTVIGKNTHYSSYQSFFYDAVSPNAGSFGGASYGNTQQFVPTTVTFTSRDHMVVSAQRPPSGVGLRSTYIYYGMHGLGIALILFDILNTPISPGPDTGIAGAAMIASARASSVAARAGANSIDDLVRAAQRRFPGKAGRIEQHHVVPKYLGGAASGRTVPLDAAYHQQITNEFRRLWPYGQGTPSAAELQRIMQEVYTKFPLP